MKNHLTYPDFYKKTFSELKHDQKSINEFSKVCPTGDILEIGAGNGRTLGFIEDRKHIMLESDPEMIAELRRRIKEFHNAEVIEAKCPKIPIKESSLAGIIIPFCTIGEINPICSLLMEIKRVLKPGGKVFINTINTEKFKSPSLGIYRTRNYKTDGYSFVSNTLPLINFGNGEYQTQFLIRSPNQTQLFIIKQYFPSISQWITIANQVGLLIQNKENELSDSDVLNLILVKPENNLNIGTSSVEEIYDSIGKDYDNYISNAEYGLENWINPFFEKLINLHPQTIDLACGNGLVGKILKKVGVKPSELIGYDISSTMISECKKNHIYDQAYKMDLSFGLPGIGGMSIDLITAFGLMEFIANSEILLNDVRRILTLGGELYCSFESTVNEDYEDQVESNFNGKPIKRYRYSENKIRKLMNESGLTLTNIEKRMGYKSPSTGLYVDYYFVRATKNNI